MRGSRREAGRRAGAPRRKHAAPGLRRPGAASPRTGAVIRARDGVHARRVRGRRGDHPASFRRALNDDLYRHVDLRARARTGWTGRPPTWTGRARVRARIAAAGGIDLVLLGIGGNGHSPSMSRDRRSIRSRGSWTSRRRRAPGRRRCLRRRARAGARADHGRRDHFVGAALRAARLRGREGRDCRARDSRSRRRRRCPRRPCNFTPTRVHPGRRGGV